jgi:hypothetical protein
MTCGQGLIDLMNLAKEDKNEHHRALIAAAFAKPLASVTKGHLNSPARTSNGVDARAF